MGRLLLVTVSTIALAALSACGGPDTPKYEPQILAWAYQYHGPGKYDGKLGEVAFPGAPTDSNETAPVLNATERAKYCAVYVDAETDAAAKKQLLSDLSATWKREISGSFDFPPFGVTFGFSDSKGTASLSGAFLEPDESIGFNTPFVSKPVATGTYKDFRIIELPANNNAGVAAFAVKFVPNAKGHTNPVLLMTARKYWRYGQTDSVLLPGEVFEHDKDNEQSVRLWIYPTKK